MTERSGESLQAYLERKGLCPIFDVLLRCSSASDPYAQMMSKLEEAHLAKLGFLNRRFVEGSKVALNKRCVVCTDLSYTGEASLRLRVEMLVKTVKLLASMNATVVVCFYDDSAPCSDDTPMLVSTGSATISPLRGGKRDAASTATPPPPSASTGSGSGAVSPLTAGVVPPILQDDSLLGGDLEDSTSVGLNLLRERLAAERFNLVVFPNGPLDITATLDFSNLPHNVVHAVPNLSGHPNDRLDAPLAFLNPLIAYGDLYVCDALSHMPKQTLCTTALPRAIGEVVLGVNASQELRGLGPIICGSSFQNGNRVLLIGDDDTETEPHAALTAPSSDTAGDSSPPLSGAAVADDAVPPTSWVPLLHKFEPAFDNMMNLFDVILVAGTAARPLREVLRNSATDAAAAETPAPPVALRSAGDGLIASLRRLVDLARRSGVRVIPAVDWVITKRTASGKVRGDFISIDATELPTRFRHADVGPESLNVFCRELSVAESVCMVGRLADPSRSHLGAVLKVPGAANDASNSSTPQAPSPFVYSHAKLLASLPPKVHAVSVGNSWVDALAFIKVDGKPMPNTLTSPVGKKRPSPSIFGSPAGSSTQQQQQQQSKNQMGGPTRPGTAAMNAIVSTGLPEPLTHASTLPYDSLVKLLAGGVFDSFAALPLPTVKKV